MTDFDLTRFDLILPYLQTPHFQLLQAPIIGYKGEFKKRTRALHDGCAIFYKTSVFDCLSVVPVEYLKPGVSVLDRDNVALILLLRPKLVPNTSTRLCVANTHLLFNPRRGDVKLAQLMLLFAEIDRLAFRCNLNTSRGLLPSYHPILFCGDLNMEPFCHLYRFVSSGVLPLDGVTVRRLSGQERSWNRGSDPKLSPSFLDNRIGISDASQYIRLAQERSKTNSSIRETSNEETEQDVTCEYTQGSGTVSHRLGFRSVYRHYMEYGNRHYKHRVREVSTSHSRANCTVDYIFYSSGVADDSRMVADIQLETDVDPICNSSSSPSSVASPVNVEPVQLPSSQNSSDDRLSYDATECNDKIQLLARLKLLSDRDMKQIGGLPNEMIASDHLALAAHFALKVDNA